MPYVYRPSILLSTIFTETSSNIVFEHPGITPAASKGEATPPGDARKLWGAEEGVPLVAMLQEKTLQTATYAVQKSATQSMFYHQRPRGRVQSYRLQVDYTLGLARISLLFLQMWQERLK